MTRDTSPGSIGRSPRLGAGELADGWGADDGVGLVFRGTELVEVVASRPHAGAVRVERTAGGSIEERRLAARYLGD